VEAPISQYYFKVRAIDSCKLYSVFSKPLYVTYDSVPKAIDSIKTKVDECSLNV
jgi:hypothetical protein